MSAPANKEAEAPKKGKGMMVMMIVLVLLGGGAGAGWYFMQGKAAKSAEGEHAEESAAPKLAVYLPLAPPFVVNLADVDAARYLQADIEVMARDPKVIEDAKLHMPQIRNRILMMLGQQRVADITTREGKEALQAKILAEIQKIMKRETGKPGIEAIYFTSFVMQ